MMETSLVRSYDVVRREHLLPIATPTPRIHSPRVPFTRLWGNRNRLRHRALRGLLVRGTYLAVNCYDFSSQDLDPTQLIMASFHADAERVRRSQLHHLHKKMAA